MRIKVSPWVASQIVRKRKQFRMDKFCAGGKGGQNQNKVFSGCRITDLVTGISAEGRDQRTFEQNRKNAFRRCVQKMIKYYQDKEPLPETNQESGWIRTYKDGTVIDKRVPDKRFDMKRVLDGNLDPLHQAILESKK